MKLILKSDYGYMPEVTISWCDVAEMHHAAKKVKEVLKNHKDSKESDAKRIYLSDDDLKDIYSILFRLTHRHEVYVGKDGKESHKYTPIVENEDFDINEFI